MASPFPAVLAVSNYEQMLGKIAFYFWVACSVSLLVLIPMLPWLAPVERVARNIGGSFATAVGAPWVAVPALLIAAVLAVIAHSVKLHDRISNSFHIRERFDLDCILWPLALRCGVTITSTQAERVRVSRNKVMHECFYKYASSTAPDAVVSKHDIQQALTSWSWIWVSLEARIVFWVSALLCAFEGKFQVAFWFSVAALVCAALSTIFEAETRKYAVSQIDQIAADNARKTHIVGVMLQI